MARTSGAVLGKQSGRIGQIYGALVHGEQVYRALPSRKKTASDQIPANVADQRERFKALVSLAKAFKTASNIGFDKFRWVKPFISPFNYFVKVNKAAVAVVDGMVETDFGSLMCSQGDLPQVGFATASFAEPLSVTVPFTTNVEAPSADAQDKVYLFVYQPDSNQGLLSAPVQRTTATVEMHLPSTWTGMTVHLYGFTIGDGRENKGLASFSSYIGTGIVG